MNIVPIGGFYTFELFRPFPVHASSMRDENTSLAVMSMALNAASAGRGQGANYLFGDTTDRHAAFGELLRRIEDMGQPPAAAPSVRDNYLCDC